VWNTALIRGGYWPPGNFVEAQRWLNGTIIALFILAPVRLRVACRDLETAQPALHFAALRYRMDHK
jgi:hypothetical protein